MIRVVIFLAGYSECDIASVVRLLSLPGCDYVFEPGPRIQTMGDPDLYGFAYSDGAFLRLVDQYRDLFDICAILTTVPIADNFFTRTIDFNTIISTSFQADELMDRSGRSLSEYYALAICQELISFAFQRVSGLPWTDLFHKETRGCLFDFAGSKRDKIAKLKKCDICPQTIGLLAQHNVNDRTVSFVKTILQRIRRPSVRKSLLNSVTSPILGFVYGGVVIGFVVNVVSSLVLNTSPLTHQQVRFIWLLAGCIPLFPLAVYVWSWVKYARKRFSEVNA
jgi:hypothetical protein